MKPARSYVICCVQRTGSWLLAHTLADTGYAGRPSDVWLRRQDKVRQGISWWRAGATGQWALRPDQEPGQPALDVERIVALVRFAQQCEDGWRQWFAATGIRPYKVVYEDLSRDRLGVANGVLEFLRLPRLGAGDLPPVRYRQQADDLTDRYADLVRSALSSPAGRVRLVS